MNLYLVLGITVTLIGAIIGRVAVTSAQRSSAGPESAGRRRYGVLLTFIVIGIALLLFDAVQTERHRWLNIAVVVIMIGGVAFDWIRSRRARTS